MSEVRALIEQLVSAGIDPVDAAEIITRAAIVGATTQPRSAGAVRQERYRRNKSSQSVTGDADSGPFPDKEIPQTPLENNPIQDPPSAPKGASSPADTDAAIKAYSEMAARSGLAVPRVVTTSRRARLNATLRQHGLPAWIEAVGKVGSSAFCCGENDRGWKADLDFLLQAKTFPKILEGAYNNRAPMARGSPSGRPPTAQELLKAQRESFANHDEPPPDRPYLIAAR